MICIKCVILKIECLQNSEIEVRNLVGTTSQNTIRNKLWSRGIFEVSQQPPKTHKLVPASLFPIPLTWHILLWYSYFGPIGYQYRNWLLSRRLFFAGLPNANVTLFKNSYQEESSRIRNASNIVTRNIAKPCLIAAHLLSFALFLCPLLFSSLLRFCAPPPNVPYNFKPSAPSLRGVSAGMVPQRTRWVSTKHLTLSDHPPPLIQHCEHTTSRLLEWIAKWMT